MSNRVSLSPRDVSLLRLLSWTPATTALLHRASEAFEGGPFGDERRLRERLQALADAGLVRSWPAAAGSGGLQNYYKLTPVGFDVFSGAGAVRPGRAFFTEVPPSVFVHTFRLAEVIVETLRAATRRRVTVERFFRENELTFDAGAGQVQPDCFMRLVAGGPSFNLAFEVDNSTASVESAAANSIRQKLLVYDAYQDTLLRQWLAGGKAWERPRFRVVFLTPSVPRAYHILSHAAELARHPTRCLVYAATFESYVTDSDQLFAPLFIDHKGRWHALLDLHPTAPFGKAPVRLPRVVEKSPSVW